MTMSHYPHGFSNGVTVRNMPVLNAYSGEVYWVDSNAARTSGAKGSFSNPYLTLGAAADNTKLANGDTIVIKAGHTESLAATVTLDTKVKVLGLGEGAMRPKFTMTTASIYGLTISTDDVTISNLYFAASTAAVTGRIYVGGDRCTVENCYFLCGAYDTNTILMGVTAGVGIADDFSLIANEFHVTASGPATAIHIPKTCVRTKIMYNLFNGMSAANAWTSGAVYSSGVHTHCLVQGNNALFMYASTGAVRFTAAATGLIRDNFFGGGVLGYMLDPGSCYCSNDNIESDSIDKKGRIFPTTEVS